MTRESSRLPDAFPHYRRTEQIADRWVHAIGILGAVVGVAALLIAAGEKQNLRLAFGVGLYGFGIEVSTRWAGRLFPAAIMRSNPSTQAALDRGHIRSAWCPPFDLIEKLPQDTIGFPGPLVAD